jgi:hypothetical protein
MTSARASHRQAAVGRKAAVKTSRTVRGSSVGVVVSLLVLAVALVAFSVTTRRAAPTTTTPAQGSTLQPTGEMNAMGVPFVQTPGSASGTAVLGPITVVGSNYSLGQVPLDVAVLPTWTLTNTGDRPVELGEPTAEVRQGCCPGPLELGTTTLAPGASTQLAFELTMHPGMDGWHDMAVYVPISGQPGVLELSVTGDFRD